MEYEGLVLWFTHIFFYNRFWRCVLFNPISTMFTDGLHPNNKGYVLLASKIQAVVASKELFGISVRGLQEFIRLNSRIKLIFAQM